MGIVPVAKRSLTNARLSDLMNWHGHVVRLLIDSCTLPTDILAIAYAERLPTVQAIEFGKIAIVDRFASPQVPQM